MLKTVTPLAGVAVAALLLAGCTTSTPESATSSDTQSSPAPSGDAQMPQGMGGFGGVSGEIVLAQDGLLQVQDASSQTAVRYTDATTVLQQADVALADIEVGQCVFAITDDSGAATTVTVSDAVDGECTGGFGGAGVGGAGMGGGAMGDERPDGEQPSDLPTNLPTDMPTDFPDGGADGGPGQMPSGSFVVGAVTAVGEESITVEGTDGVTETTVSGDTPITGTVAADTSAIAVGLCLTAQGEADDVGGFDATQITLSAKGDEGCSTGFGGGFGGGPGGGQRPGGNG